jgi:hypothetical protein
MAMNFFLDSYYENLAEDTLVVKKQNIKLYLKMYFNYQRDPHHLCVG